MALVAYLQAATAERLGSDRWMPIVTLAGPPWPPDGATSPSSCSPPPTTPGLQQNCLAGRYLQLTGPPPPRRPSAQSSRPAMPRQA